MTEVAPYINNKYGTAYQLMGDFFNRSRDFKIID